MSILSVGAIADVASEDPRRRVYADIDVREFVELADGRRLIADELLGFSASISGVRLGARPDPWTFLSRESVKRDVAIVVTAEGSAGIGRWGRIVRTCARHGVDVTVDQLDVMPFVIELSEQLERRLGDAGR